MDGENTQVTVENQAPEQADVTNQQEVETQDQQDGNNELARLKAEIAKQKLAIDKATKEAADYKRALRAKQSAEEVAAEEKRIADEARNQELADLKKKFAVAEIGKKVMGLGADDATSTKIAELMYGAEDVDAALNEIGKIWAAKEKALRIEFGKIPLPGAGGTDDATNEAVKRAIQFGKAKADADKTAQEAMKAYLR